MKQNIERNHLFGQFLIKNGVIKTERLVRALENQKNRLQHADIEIRPDVNQYGILDYKYGREYIEIGRRAAEEKMEDIHKLLRQRRLGRA